MLSAWRGFYRYLTRDHGAARRTPASASARRKAPNGCRMRCRPTKRDSWWKCDATDALAVRDKAMFELFYSSGLRLAELISLEPGDVDFADATVRVTGKGSKTRIVPVGSHAIAALHKWLAERAALPRVDEQRCSSTSGAAVWVRARSRPECNRGRCSRASLPGASAHAAPFLRFACAAIEQRPARGAGNAGPFEHFDDTGIYAAGFSASGENLRRGTPACPTEGKMSWILAAAGLTDSMFPALLSACAATSRAQRKS